MKLLLHAFIIATMMRSVAADYDCSKCVQSRSSFPSTVKLAMERAIEKGIIGTPNDGQTHLQLFAKYYLDHVNEGGGLLSTHAIHLPRIECWDLTGLDSLEMAFHGRQDLDGRDLNCWDTSEITNMQKTFEFSNFYGSVSSWNTSKVISMADLKSLAGVCQSFS